MAVSRGLRCLQVVLEVFWEGSKKSFRESGVVWRVPDAIQVSSGVFGGDLAGLIGVSGDLMGVLGEGVVVLGE